MALVFGIVFEAGSLVQLLSHKASLERSVGLLIDKPLLPPEREPSAPTLSIAN